MIEHTVKMHVIPSDDRSFHDAVCRVWDHLRAEHVTVDERRAAIQAEAELHEAGYPQARVDYARTMGDLMHATCRWTVHRDALH